MKPVSQSHHAPVPYGDPITRRGFSWKLAGIVALTAILGALVLLHTQGLNGPPYWKWEWRRLPPWRAYPFMLLAATPFAAAQAVFYRSRPTRRGVVACLALLMASQAALQVTSTSLQRGGFDLGRAREIIGDRYNMSYFLDAARVDEQGWSTGYLLRTFPRQMPGFHIHGRGRPPGPVLLFLTLIRFFGPDRALTVAAGVMATAAALSIPAMFKLADSLTGDRGVGLAAASVMALCPSMVQFYPVFDPWHPMLTCGIFGFWAVALRRNQHRYAFAMAATLAFALFFAYQFLVLGVLLAGFAGLCVHYRVGGCDVGRVLRHATIVLVTVAAIYLTFWKATGFDPIQTFQVGIGAFQRTLDHFTPEQKRIWPFTIGWDLLDFALGAGWVTIALAGYWWLDRPSAAGTRFLRGVVALCFIQVAIVGLTGLLRGETARVWLFMLPLALLPAGLELARWTAWERWSFYACLWTLTAILTQNMTFEALPVAPPQERRSAQTPWILKGAPPSPDVLQGKSRE